ncbi:clavaminate synthase-like protein [Iris pallida]|uniref:Clavaminate synthase-like protein n=1 Tax=Iris pallida TaxID=29817 RepID=A0AAX6EPP2_IRIPA|nr:clavaminate synthase-like protein [Iris pallida]
MAAAVAMGFGEGSIEGEKVFRGAVFPKTLVPASPAAAEADCRSLERLVETVERERAAIAELLHLHGAVLFRGFDVRSAEEFDRAVRSFGWEAMEHLGATTRIKMTDRVYTANEAPVDKLINFHHEMSVMKQSPSKIFFFCSEPAPEGGETSIVQSNVVVEKMEERLPEVVAKLKEEGLIYRNRMVKDSEVNSGTVMNKTWKWFFKTDDEAEAEKRAKETLNCSSITFNSDGSADIAFGPANPMREFGGKRAWFMPFLGYTEDIYGVDNSFGDGSKVPREALVAYREILEENCVDVKWQRGDILLVDNHTVQHARRPGKPPRVVLVSVCK